MNKYLFVISSFVACLFLFQIYLDNVGVNDVLNVVEGNANVIDVVKEKVSISEEKDEDLSILAFGDLMMGRYVRTLIDKNGSKNYVFNNLKSSDQSFFEGMGLEKTDIVHANLEGPIKGKGRSGGTSMIFGFNEDVAPFLAENGINLVSISNNHAFDQGLEGRKTTIEALKNAGVGYCGHPSEVDPDSVYYGKDGDKTFAFICLHSAIYKLDQQKAVELIQQADQNVDYVIVSIHWGYEYKHKPDAKKQVDPAHAFIDAGADLIIGHHPHVVQSFEVYKDRLIFYSLGNFVFDQYWSKDTQEELAIRIEISGDGKVVPGDNFKTTVQLLPMKSEKSQSRLMNELEKKDWVERFIGYGNYTDEMKSMIRQGLIKTE